MNFDSNNKTINCLRNDIDRQKKQIITTINKLCNECGFCKERYLSPCSGCAYGNLKKELQKKGE